MLFLTVRVDRRCSHKMALMLKKRYCLFVCPGNVLLLLVIAAPLSPTVHTYMLLSILGLELLVALPCLFYYIGMVHSCPVFFITSKTI